MGHYAAEMGVDTPRDTNSKEYQAALEADRKHQARIDNLAMSSIRGMNSDWMNRKKRKFNQGLDGDGI